MNMATVEHVVQATFYENFVYKLGLRHAGMVITKIDRATCNECNFSSPDAHEPANLDIGR